MKQIIFKSTITCINIILIFCFLVFADENNFGFLNGKYFKNHQIGYFPEEGEMKFADVQDILEIYIDEKGDLHFKIENTGPNFHLCRLEGKAIRKTKYWEYNDTIRTGELCSLRIHYKDKAIVIEDVNQICRIGKCGARAGLNNYFKLENKFKK